MRKILLGSCLIFIILCIGAFIVWLWPRLLPPSNRMIEININKLLVNVDDFPSGWKANGPPGPVREDELDWGEKNVFIVFHSIDDQDVAYQYVYKFRNEVAAEYGLFWIKKEGLLTPPMNAVEPMGWKYKSLSADEWLFGCSTGNVCTSLARYDEFIIIFTASINSDYMTFNDLEYLFKVMDGKIGKYLDHDYK